MECVFVYVCVREREKQRKKQRKKRRDESERVRTGYIAEERDKE